MILVKTCAIFFHQHIHWVIFFWVQYSLVFASRCRQLCLHLSNYVRTRFLSIFHATVFIVLSLTIELMHFWPENEMIQFTGGLDKTRNKIGDFVRLDIF